MTAPLTPFTITLAASPLALAPGATTTLTAVASQDVGPTPWYIEIFEDATSTLIAECGSGTTCSTNVAQSSSTVRTYTAYVAGLGSSFPPPNIQATSAILFVSWLTVNLGANTTASQPNTAVTLTATASVNVGPTPFYIQIFDVTNDTQVAICGFGTTCATNVTQGRTMHTYVAYVARPSSSLPPPDIRALSTAVTVSWLVGEVQNQFTSFCMAVSGAGPGVVPGSGTQIVQWDCNGFGDKLWTFEPFPDGSVQVRNSFTNLCLAVSGAGPGAVPGLGAQIVQADCNGSADRHWNVAFNNGSSGPFTLVNTYTNMCPAVSGAGPGVVPLRGTEIIQWDCNGFPDKLWNSVP